MAKRENVFLRNQEGEFNALKPGVYDFKAEALTEVERMIITIEDKRLDIGGYGALPALTGGGINMFICRQDGSIESLLNFDPTEQFEDVRIRRTFDWPQFCFDVNLIEGGGTDIAFFRYTFSKAGAPVFIESGESIAIDFPDDLYRGGRGLKAHLFNLQFNVLLQKGGELPRP